MARLLPNHHGHTPTTYTTPFYPKHSSHCTHKKTLSINKLKNITPFQHNNHPSVFTYQNSDKPA